MDDIALAEVTRGGRVESLHLGRIAVTDDTGRVIRGLGAVEAPVFPRSTVKALLALPLVETGAADRLGLTDAELALACASHGGEIPHVRTASRMLAAAGQSVACLECGAHWPSFEAAARAVASDGAGPTALHNNCSGKHAGLICLAADQGLDPKGYVDPAHAVQRQVTSALEMATSVPHTERNRGLDGCSMPTYAIPLSALATGFARFGTGRNFSSGHASAAARLRSAVASEPFMVAGSGRFDTTLMAHFGQRIFCKMGAEGVMVAALPECGLGIAIKTSDGANRAAEVALAALLLELGAPLWSSADQEVLHGLSCQVLKNWNGREVGMVRAAGKG
ncbi:asparaginase [Swaminathania salitolerans]|uniref:Asparaginase n=1 Tax=Swaminathania salitolerans TaxID=182838 RepID=A0A511BQU0_9PROT|nr:asparaginase [Swaminathania salitolerans]GBQ12037.1 L-asparaginase II [Swaminathania salitolerans LMG 21291]GEL02709.1 asparaginase [Swaminathania salitolerans]